MKIELLGSLLALTLVACAQNGDTEKTSATAVSANDGRNDLFTRMGGNAGLNDLMFGVETEIMADPGLSARVLALSGDDQLKLISCTRSELKKLMTNPTIDETQSAEINGAPCPPFPALMAPLHLSKPNFGRFVNIAAKHMLYAAGKNPEVRAVEASFVMQVIESSSSLVVDPAATP